MVSFLPGDSDLINLWNSLKDILSNIPVISFRPVSLSLKLKGRVLKQNPTAVKFFYNKAIKLKGTYADNYLCHILSMDSTVCLGPFYLTGISLHFKVFMTFRPTKSKNLQNRNS